MRARLLNSPATSFFLLGPRGTGKSTWVRAQFPKAPLCDLLDAQTFQRLNANPSRLLELCPPNYEGWIVIDEVQRVPELLNEVHRLIEQGKHSFVLTGSSARKLRRGGVNLLAGRALNLAMHPFTPEELGADFNLAHALRYGLLPMATAQQDPSAYLNAYVQTYLQEEVLNEGLTRSLGVFSRFLEAAAFSQGSLLNIAQVARECGVKRKLAEGYFQILNDLMLAHRLLPFTRRAKRRLVQHPKFYFFDTGVYRTLRPSGPLDKPEEIEGVALETLVLQSLLAINNSLAQPYGLYFWRTATGSEVDFVLYGPRGLIAIEVKRAREPSPKDLRGLRAFKHDYPMARCLVLYGGEKIESRDDDLTLHPLGDFLRHARQYLDM